MGNGLPLSPELLGKSRRAKTETENRVRELIRQTGEYETAERRREQAQIAYDNGNKAALEETLVGPTPEQLTHAEYERVEVKKEQGTVRSISTLRRVLVPQVMRLWHSGVIDNGQMSACRWYRDCHEATGLVGNIPSTDYSKEVFAAPQNRDFFNAFQLDVQDNYRFVRSQITARWLPFFDGVVLEDEGLQKAIKRSRARAERAVGIFRETAAELQIAYDELKGR